MKGLLGFTCLAVQMMAAYTFIIPDELPSLLSVIYSNIPTLKKGTDSRLGWGFRLGDRADFQVLVELGPQKYTQPLGNQKDEGDSGNSKRNTIDNLSNTLYAQRQEEKKQISNTAGGKWLDQWSKGIKQQQQPEQQPESDLGVGEIDAKSVIPDDSVLELEKLYRSKQKAAAETEKLSEASTTKKEEFAKPKEAEKSKEVVSTTVRPKTTTSAKDALDNVEIEE